MLKYNRLLKISDNFYKKAINFQILQNTLIIPNLSLFSDKKISEEEADEWMSKNKGFNKILDNYFYSIGNGQFKKDNGAMFVSLKNEEPDNLKIIESGIFNKTQNIPTLYYFQGKAIVNYDAIKNITKENSKYSFILHCFPSLLDNSTFKEFDDIGETISEITVELFNEFINTNKQKIDRLLTFCKQYPKAIGSGSDSIAFDIGGNFILKLFSSDSLYVQYKKTLDKLHEDKKTSEYEMMIYDVSKLGTIDNINIYYVITEKMKPISSQSLGALNYIKTLNSKIGENLNDNKSELLVLKKMFKNKKNINKTIKRIKEYAKFLAHQISLELENDYKLMASVHSFEEVIEKNQLKDNWMESYIEEVILKVITGHGDLHDGNLGITNYGSLRFFDSFHPDCIDSLHMPGFENNIDN